MLERLKMSYGSDPELFVKRNGHIIGSEKVVDLGLKYRDDDEKFLVIRDGVQIELNPSPKLSVYSLGEEISKAFRILRTRISNRDNTVQCCFDGLVEVSRKELDSLSPECQILGCMPSKNVYGTKPINVDAKEYRKRSAGGHLHLGFSNSQALFENRTDVVVPLDILVGNTCVMLDRDPGAAERRENYGRAGEYRMPKHGIEYRTLSNFWLRNYALMDLVFGLANLALSVVNERVSNNNDIEEEMAKSINVDSIQEAINKNDARLARENFVSLMPFLRKHLPTAGFPLTPGNIDRFLLFADSVQEFGIELFFGNDPVSHWCDGSKVHFTEFLDKI